MKKSIMAILFLAGMLTGCNENSESGNENGMEEYAKYPVTHFKKIELRELKKEPGTPTVTLVQTYTYDDGRLTNATAVQSFATGGESFKIENKESIVYQDHLAIVTNEASHVSTYTLDDNGYAVSCVRQETGGKTRTYTFDYFISKTGKHLLKNITETIDGSQSPYSVIDIDHSKPQALRISRKVDTYEQTYIAATSSDNETTNEAEIPYLFLSELYPLSLHSAAMYGKLIGDAYDTLITRLTPNENGNGNNESTTYTYTFGTPDADISCREVTNSYGTNYVRTVDYNME